MDLNGVERDGPTDAADAARPRGIRSPEPGPDAGETGDLVGKEMEVERRFECDTGFRDKAGVGEVSLLKLVFSYEELGREEEPEPERCRSAVVVIKRRVRADGASSSSLDQ